MITTRAWTCTSDGAKTDCWVAWTTIFLMFVIRVLSTSKTKCVQSLKQKNKITFVPLGASARIAATQWSVWASDAAPRTQYSTATSTSGTSSLTTADFLLTRAAGLRLREPRFSLPASSADADGSADASAAASPSFSSSSVKPVASLSRTVSARAGG